MGTYHIWTVGCQVNMADSAKLSAGLRRLGWEPTDRPQDADFVVLNTCAVRQRAEDKAASKLGQIQQLKAQRPDLKVAVMGCTVGPRSGALAKRWPFVDVFAQPQRFQDVISVLGLPDHDLGGEFWPAVFPDDGSPGDGSPGDGSPDTPRPTAFVPIVEGCDKFCTYCIVPLRRGRERSRPIAEIRREVEAHVARGVREVTLLGQTVEAYGKDQPAPATGRQEAGLPADGPDHADLSDLMAALHAIPRLQRMRALTSYPPDMTDRILEGMAALPKVCESFSLPAQSGDDDVLARMRRGYTRAEFVERVQRLRSLMPAAGISTDLIVGFPGESDAQFQRSLDLLEELRFDKVHVAAYSPRPDTYAYRQQPDDVPVEVKAERLQAVEDVQRRIAFARNHAYWGRTVEVLVESVKPGSEGEERLSGRTRANKLVHFSAPTGTIAPGAMAHVRVTHTGPWALQGRPLDDAGGGGAG